MNYFGDILLGSTIVIPFTTIGTTGAPAQLAGTTATTISMYPGVSTTQITAGATLTTDNDGVTGFNIVGIAATGGNGFAVATDYSVVLATGTVGGTTVAGYCIGSFSVQNRMAKLAAQEITPSTFTAGAIVATTFAAGAITSTVLAGGAITSAILTTGAIGASNFVAGAITSTVLAAGAVHSTIFTTGAIVATTFAAGAINSTVVADNTIDAATFTSGAIVATTFAAGAITSTVLAAGAIHSTIFTTNAIVATTFAIGAITSTVLAAGAIHSTIFTTGAIVATTFAANAIGAATIADAAIDAATFASGAITSTVLAAGAITSSTFTTGAIVGTTFAGVLPSNFSTMSISAAGLVAITSSIKKNATAAGFMFVMTDMTTHVPVAGLTIVGTRALDGGAFGALANSGSIASVGSGTYAIDLVPADVNANHVMLRFTNATTDDLNIEIITQP